MLGSCSVFFLSVNCSQFFYRCLMPVCNGSSLLNTRTQSKVMVWQELTVFGVVNKILWPGILKFLEGIKSKKTAHSCELTLYRLHK